MLRESVAARSNPRACPAEYDCDRNKVGAAPGRVQLQGPGPDAESATTPARWPERAPTSSRALTTGLPGQPESGDVSVPEPGPQPSSPPRRRARFPANRRKQPRSCQETAAGVAP